ncbi:MAG: enoyl-CoA hydratase/isomerase family protein, partial [Myxococcota bacterium]
MSFETIEFTRRDDGIAVVRLNRPQRLNAINGRVLEDLDAAVRAVDADPGIRVFLLCGAPRPDGRPCFSAGFDLKSPAEGARLDPYLGARLTDRIDDLLKPSIAVVDGVCSTGGAELALACDFRLAAKRAKLGLTEVTLGLVPAMGGTQRLPKLV